MVVRLCIDMLVTSHLCIFVNYSNFITSRDQIKGLTDVIKWCEEKYCCQKDGSILLEKIAILFDDNPAFRKLYAETLYNIKPDYETCTCGTYLFQKSDDL